MGYTDKLLTAVRKVPGMEKADEGTLLGMLSLGGSVFLGGGEALSIAEGAPLWPGMLKVGYNVISFPANTLFDFQRTRGTMEKWFGKELRFKYRDSEGKEQTTEPISTQRLLQQMALISGAAGITTYGTALDVWQIQFTGVMFMLCNGLSIERIVRPTAKEPVANQAAKLKDAMEAAMMTGTLDDRGFTWTPGEHAARARELMKEIKDNLDLKPTTDKTDWKNLMDLARHWVAAASGTIAAAWTPPEKRASMQR
ncbi:MAG: hypothetical protein LW823_06700 [Rickettsiales bacterium]|jgi:hypothetical protein|nr:hypothetical protein [Rickettsiales bacterium]